MIKLIFACTLFVVGSFCAVAQVNDANTPLHLLKSAYQTPYGAVDTKAVKDQLDLMLAYLDKETPVAMVDNSSNQPLKQLKAIDANSRLAPGAFRMISYEWGVTYSGMLNATEATGDIAFQEYVTDRMSFIASLRNYYQKLPVDSKDYNPVRSVLYPHALDDAGAMCAAMIRTKRNTAIKTSLRPLINNYISYIMEKQFRLADGTLARNRPLANTLWLDDMYMSIPAIAEMGKLTGEKRYFDEATMQVKQFAKRMWVEEKGLFIHGWVQEMEPHRAFHWARANGWAFMTLTNLLDVLPEDHTDYDFVLKLYQKHAKGLARYQSGEGFWHQLIDRTDSYLETSATAIYAYCYARGINRGWLNAMAYGPVAVLSWNAVSTKINDLGQVEGTCVGTGMGFDPAFYYYRLTNVFAAHGYGPALLAGSEMIRLTNKFDIKINDSALMFYQK